MRWTLGGQPTPIRIERDMHDMIALGVGSMDEMLMRITLLTFQNPGSSLSQLAFREANLENEAVMDGRLLISRRS